MSSRRNTCCSVAKLYLANGSPAARAAFKSSA
jgi:hypothetical protein